MSARTAAATVEESLPVESTIEAEIKSLIEERLLSVFRQKNRSRSVFRLRTMPREADPLSRASPQIR